MLGAPAYARLAGRLAVDPAPAARVLGDDESWYAALRLFGAVHYLVLTGVAPEALSGWDQLLQALTRHEDALRAFVAAQDVQTNEVQRCVGLLPCFLTVAQETGLPLELLELGASAGLNLQFDRYRYRYARGTWGPDDALVAFDVADRGTVPPGLLKTPLVVRARSGVDLAPVDATSDEGMLLLRAFVWPGRDDRLQRLRGAATTMALAGRPRLVAGDYVQLLPSLLDARPSDAATVVFQTASTGYIGADGRATLRATLERAGADGRPLAWVSTRASEEREGDDDSSWELELRLWPGPARLAARLDFHGNWVEWLG
jgi:hypothetical protein